MTRATHYDPDAQSKKLAASFEALSNELSEQAAYPSSAKLPEKNPKAMGKPLPRQIFQMLVSARVEMLKRRINMRLKMKGIEPIDWQKIRTIH